MNKSEESNARERILKAAEKIFAEKGFDGSRVDGIAKEAGVNKALIYYYFKSKDEILEALLANFIENINFARDKIDENDFKNPSELSEVFFDTAFDYLFEKKELLKIVFMEELKGRGKMSTILKHWSETYQTEKEAYKKIGIKMKEDDKSLIGGFFIGFIPFINYIIYNDQFCEFFKLDREETKKSFKLIMKNMRETSFNRIFE